MLFTIIIPTINRTRSIFHTLSSIFTQTYPRWEIIIVDSENGKLDTTLQPLLSEERRIRYIKRPLITSSEARAAGISAARGDIITFIDSDDYISPTHLQTHHDFFIAHPTVDMIVGKPTVIGSPYVKDAHPSDHYSHINTSPMHGTFFIREHVFDTVRKLPEVDHGSLLHELIRNHRFVTRHIPMPTYIYDRTGST